MKRTRVGLWFLAVGVGVSMAFAAGVGAAKAAGQDSEFKYFAGLFDKDRETATQTLSSAVGERSQKIAELIKIVQLKRGTEVSDETLKDAIRLLGVYRARQARDVLLPYLASWPPSEGVFNRFYSEPIAPHMFYPAVRALVEIGDGRTPKRLAFTIRSSDDPVERELAAFVIWKITNEEQAISLLSRTRSGGSYEEIRRLDEAINWVKTFKGLPSRMNTWPAQPARQQQP